MTTVNEFNFQINDQGAVSPTAREEVPAALLDHVKTAIERIQKSPHLLHKQFYQQLLENKSFKVVNDGRHTKEVPVQPSGTLTSKEVLTVNIQIKQKAICPIDCSDPEKMKKIEACFKSKVAATESTPIKPRDIQPVKKSRGLLDTFFASVAKFFGSCAGRPPKKMERTVVRVAPPTAETPPKAPTASSRVVPNKPLPPPPVQAETASVALRGIDNEGNTCFINAVFQMIMHDEILTAALLGTYLEEVQKRDQYEVGYQCFINAVMNYRDGQPVSLKNLRVLLHDTSLQPGVQGDASEILLALLNPLNQDKYHHLFVALGTGRKWARFIPPKDKAQDYQRVFERRSKSKEGLSVMPPDGEMPAQYDSKDNNKGLVIPLQIPESPVIGQALIKQSFDFHAVPLGEEAAYQDGWYQPVAEKLSLQRAPERCIIQLKRFNPDRTKNNTRVEMPENLTLQEQKYRLKSIVVHVPGHYYSLIRKESKWFVANDSLVSRAQDDELQYALNQGYLYFYERV